MYDRILKINKKIFCSSIENLNEAIQGIELERKTNKDSFNYRAESLFDEYDFISMLDIDTSYLRGKYIEHFIDDGKLVPSNSAIIQALATKMGKSNKAEYLLVKRTMFDEEYGRKTNSAI